jgi:hypothetical protein
LISKSFQTKTNKTSNAIQRIMDFKQLKKQSKSGIGALTEKLLKDAEKLNSSSYTEDKNIFKLETDKSGNGRAILRFLPAPSGEDAAFVRLYNHGFQVNGKWLIENCPTTHNESCFICSENSALWNSGIESDKAIARDRKRKLSYYANVYVVSNPADPSLEGTVKIFRFGQKIFDKILSAVKPEFDSDPVIEPFDFWEGANFRLIVKTVETTINGKQRKMPNYDDSKFESKSEFLGGDDDKLEAVYSQLHSLQEIVAPSKFKTNEELQKRFYMVTNSRPAPSAEEQEKELEELLNPQQDILAELEESYSKAKATVSDDDDEDLQRFMALADG